MSSAPIASAVPGLDAPTAAQLTELITRALAEDVGSGDITTLSTVPDSSRAKATFLAKETGVLSGIAAATEIFRRVDASIRVQWDAKDGDAVTKGTSFGTAEGSSRSLLVAERLVLNLMQRMSGIATAAATYIRTMGSSHTRLLDTRKTVPGLRYLDKLAVLHGGGVNHRVGLFDMILIKDNHIEASGGIAKAVAGAQAFLAARPADAPAVQVEVEARTLQEVREVLACGEQVQRILLDNMVKLSAEGAVDTSMLVEALTLIRNDPRTQSAGEQARLKTEASGNVNLKTVKEIGETGVDFVSVGALTHSVIALDISMKIKLMQ